MSAGPDDAWYRARKFLRRNLLPASIAAFVLVLIAGFIWRLADERNRALAAEQQALAAETRARSEAAATRQVSDYLVSLFEAASPERSGGKPIEPRALVDQGVVQLDTKLREQPLLHGRMLATLGGLYCTLGLPLECKARLEQALAAHRAQPDADVLLTAQYVAGLGDAHFRLGYFNEAERNYREAMALLENSVPPEDPRLVDVIQSLGVTLLDQQKLDEATVLLQRARDTQLALHGEGSVEHADALRLFAAALVQSGKAAEGRKLAEHAVGILRERLGPQSAHYADALYDLGVVMRSMTQDQSTLIEAERVFREALGLYTTLYGAESSKIARAKNDLGSMLHAQGRSLEAIPLLRDALDISRRIDGTKAPDYAINLNNLGAVLEQVGDYPAAVPLMREAYALAVQQQGAGHLRTHMLRINLGRTLALSGAAEDGLALVRPEVPADLQGAEADFIRGRRLKQLADIYIDLRQLDAATQLLDQCESHYRTLAPAEHWVWDTIARSRGNLLAAQQRHADAIAHLQRAATNYERDVGAADASTLMTKLELADSFRAVGRRAEARRLVVEVSSMMSGRLAPMHRAWALRRRLDRMLPTET